MNGKEYKIRENTKHEDLSYLLCKELENPIKESLYMYISNISLWEGNGKTLVTVVCENKNGKH